jgi:hypothetical protein
MRKEPLMLNVEQVARMWVGASANRRVDIIAGHSSPCLVGEGCRWTTLSGKPIYYPNAYKWPKRYHPSTIRVEVGADWRCDAREVMVDGIVTWIRGNFRDFDGLRIARGWISAGISGWKRVWAIRNPKSGRGFHGARGNNAEQWDGLEAAINAARAAWVIREAQDQEDTILESLSEIAEPLVTREASVEAGNCSIGTEAYAARRGWANRYYVRVDVLDRAAEPRAQLAAQAARRALAKLIGANI